MAKRKSYQARGKSVKQIRKKVNKAQRKRKKTKR